MLEAERLGVAPGDRAEVAAYLVARDFGSEIPPRAPRAYVRAVFDGAAKQFDQHLVGRLGYCAPELLAAVVRQWIGGQPAELRVLDAGCGTGLAAQLLRPLARELYGVDLSPGMLEKARALGLYDRLTAGELNESLVSAGPYDLIFAADVFPYIGDLEKVAAGCRGAMTVGGLLAFSAEEGASGDYFLGPSGRYRHSPAYLRRVLAAASFRVIAVEEAVMRREAGKPVASLVVTAEAA